MKKNITQRIVSVLAAMLCCLTSFAYSFEVAGVCYDDEGDGTVSVCSSASSSSGKYSGDVTIPSTVTYKKSTYSVTAIGDIAFEDCTSVTSVSMPSSLIKIGEKAFKGCTGLTSVVIPNSVTTIGVYAFYKCSGLTSVEIGTSVETIDGGAFQECTGLTSVVMPSTVTTLGNFAFADCTSLASVEIPNSVTAIGQFAFRNCTVLKSVKYNAENCTTVGSSDCPAFSGCTKLAILTIGDKVTQIPSCAFKNCTGLKRVYSLKLTPPTLASDALSVSSCTLYVPKDKKAAYETAGWNKIFSINELDYSFEANGIYYVFVTDEGGSEVSVTFAPNSYTGAVTIPSSVTCLEKTYNVTSIGMSAFWECTELTSVTIPNSVTTINRYAFRECTSLTSVKVDSENSNYKDDNGKAILTKDGKTLICYANKSGNSYSIPNSVTSIGYCSFSGCTGLTSVVIPNSVTSIGECAFYGCTGLTSVEIPNSVKEIDWFAFRDCTGLTSVVIPNSATSIGGYAFQDCTGLKSVEIPNSVTSIGVYAFWGCTGLTSVEIPNSVTSIGNCAFNGCTGLTSVMFNAENCTEMGSSRYPVFDGCTKLANLTIGEKVKTIPDYAFYECAGLTSVEIGSSVASIGWSAFQYCTGLTSVEIGSSVDSIGDIAFDCCWRLKKITSRNATPPVLNESVFYRVDTKTCELIVPKGSKAEYESATGWKDFTDIKELDYDFEVDGIYYNYNVRSRSDGEVSVTYKNDTYNSYSGAVTIPTSVTYQDKTYTVTSVGDDAFKGSTGLTSVEIAKSVDAIGDNAFSGCTGLTSITSLNTTPPVLGSGVFDGVDKGTCELTVPVTSNDAYRTAEGWKDFNKVTVDVATIEAENADKPVDVYNLQGELLRKQVQRSEATEGLPTGLYIVGGRKVVVR